MDFDWTTLEKGVLDNESEAKNGGIVAAVVDEKGIGTWI